MEARITDQQGKLTGIFAPQRPIGFSMQIENFSVDQKAPLSLNSQ